MYARYLYNKIFITKILNLFFMQNINLTSTKKRKNNKIPLNKENLHSLILRSSD
jgi:hypothetical protein